MDRKIAYCEDQEDFDVITKMLSDGWSIDPELKILRLDQAVVYHLVKYTAEEQAALQQSDVERVATSIKSVEINDADPWLQQGYELKDTFAKTVTLIKYQEPLADE